MDDEPRPSCNCKTSQCIQRYCQCFGGQWYCSDACRCESCMNTVAREAFLEERAELIFRRRPGGASDDGSACTCTCRKSECKKNYCACFKNRAACTERCQCRGCANTHGAKASACSAHALLHHNNGGDDSSGASDDGSTPDGSNGASSTDETATVTDEAALSPTESSFVKEIYAALGEPSNTDQHDYAPSDSHLVAFLNYSLPDQDGFSQNVHTLMEQDGFSQNGHTLMDQASMHGSTNSTLQDLLDPDLNSGIQDGPSGN